MVRAEPVRAVMTAQQGHDALAVLRDRDDRRLGALVREMRREEANENTGGADADDRCPCAEEGGEMGREALVRDIGVAFEGRRAVDRRAGQRCLDAPRKRHLAPVQDYHRGPAQRHAAPRLWTMIMEK